MADPKSFVFYTKGLECKSYFDEKTKKTRYFVKGHIDSGDLDLVNDIVTKSCMVDVSKQFKARNIKLDLDHESLRKGKDESEFDAKLNLTKIPLGKTITETLDAKGNFVEFELNPNWKKFDSKSNVVMTFKEVWDNLKSKFYDAFSIAYVPMRTAFKNLEEGKVRLLDRINLINVALTGNAINPNATITQVMAKSLEWLKAKEAKGYDKDGAHAHTDNEPLGVHNHIEIEKVIQSEVEYLNDRINLLLNRVYKLENNNPESESSTGLKNEKSGDKTMVEEDKENTENTGTDDAPEGTPQDQKKTPDAVQESNDSKQATGTETTPAVEKPSQEVGNDAEGKSIDAKAFAGLKSDVKNLNDAIGKINKVLEKALPAGLGAEDPSAKENQRVADTKSQATGTLDLI